MIEDTAKELIKKGEWAHCEICKNMFGRDRGTTRYCNTCSAGFCDDEHGKFYQYQGICIMCLDKKLAQEKAAEEKSLENQP